MDYLEILHENVKEYKYIDNCVYAFTSPSGKHYIGITKNFFGRYNGHRNGSKQRNTGKKFYDACLKYGFKNFRVQVLVQDIEDNELLKFLEVLYIEKYKTQESEFGYNMTPGGDGVQLFGENNGMYGKNHTPEAIQKMKDNGFRPTGELNAWHRSNKTQEELYVRGQKSLESRLYNISILSDTEKFELSASISIRNKKSWENIENNNLQNSLDALRYWEYKSEEELDEINKKKVRKGDDNGRSKIFILESPIGEKFEIYLDSGLKDFCKENNLIFRALYVSINKESVGLPARGDTKFYSDEEYKYKRLNTIGWKIQSYRRKDYEIDV